MLTKFIISLLVCYAMGQEKPTTSSVIYQNDDDVTMSKQGQEVRVENGEMTVIVDYAQKQTVIAMDGDSTCIVINGMLPETPTVCEVTEALNNPTISMQKPEGMIEMKLAQTETKQDVKLGPMANSMCKRTIMTKQMSETDTAEVKKVSRWSWWWPWNFYFRPCNYCYRGYYNYNYYPYYYRPCFYWRFHMCFWRYCYYFYPYYY